MQMTLTEFKARVTKAFGDRLEHATPANVREFVDKLQEEAWRRKRSHQSNASGDPNPPINLNSTDSNISWEGLLRDFFHQTLEIDSDQGLIMLWLFAIDLAYTGIEELHAERLNRLFQSSTE